MDSTFRNSAVWSLEGMEGLEATFPEDMAEVLAVMVMVKDHLEATMELTDMAVEAPEAEVEAEARPAHHRRAPGLGMMIGTAGMASAVSMNRVKFSMRKLPKVLSISTQACRVGSYGARK